MPATTERARIVTFEFDLADRIRVRSIGGMWEVGEEFVVGHGDVHSTEGLRPWTGYTRDGAPGVPGSAA